MQNYSVWNVILKIANAKTKNKATKLSGLTGGPTFEVVVGVQFIKSQIWLTVPSIRSVEIHF